MTELAEGRIVSKVNILLKSKNIEKEILTQRDRINAQLNSLIEDRLKHNQKLKELMGDETVLKIKIDSGYYELTQSATGVYIKRFYVDIEK